ncbi:MAG TPA: ABC transporter permease, partial [Ignavibacteria bacterium]|nr:ABC transporter permease [Ignavibacteria bacterium]
MKKQILNTIIRRIFTSLIVLFLLITFIFFLLRISPGNPTQKFISPELSPKLAEKVKESFNLDKPLFKQYESFIGNLIKGNFGISYTYRAPVLSVIWNFLPFTLMFSLMSFIIQIGFGFLLSFLAVKNINGKLDHLISKSSLMIYAIPSFVIGVSLIYIFSVQFNLLPSSGFSSINSYSLSFIGKLWDHLEHLILPLITLSLGGIAIYFRYLRDNLEDVYNQTFILNLRANGFSEKEITKKHVIPNAVSPLISVAGVELGLL